MKCPVYRYDKNTILLESSRRKVPPPLPANKKKLFDDAFRELKKRKCKTRWMPRTVYVKSSTIYKEITGNKHSHTFQIGEACLDVANQLEDVLNKHGISFDTGFGQNFKDWELDYIQVCRPRKGTRCVHDELKGLERKLQRELLVDFGVLR